MGVRRVITKLLPGDGLDVIVECRRCGTTVTPGAEECSECGANEISRYEIPT